MASIYDEELKSILAQRMSCDISEDEAVEKIKDNFVSRLEPYIGDDFDHARKVIAL